MRALQHAIARVVKLMRIGDGCVCRHEPNFGMRAVAKRLRGRSTAATECDGRLAAEIDFVSVNVAENDRALNHERTAGT